MIAHAVQGINRALLLLALCSFDAGATDSAATTPSSTAHAAAIGGETLHSGYLIQLIVGLLFVLLCIVALAWLAKRVNRLQSSSDGALQILGGLSMGARERVVLVQVGSTQLLLGVAPGRINMLHQLEQPLETSGGAGYRAADLPVVRGFSEKLNAALSRYK